MKKLLLIGAIALSTATFCQVPNYVPTNGLIGWWPFNGNANDESGNGNNGIPFNGILLGSDRFGNSNCSFEFDGVDDYIEVPDNSELQLLGNMSVSFWIKSPNPSPNPSIRIIDKSISNTPNGWFIAYGDPAQCSALCGANPTLLSTQNSIESNSWTHIVFTYDAFAFKIYLNSNLNSTYALSSNTIATNVPVKFGTAQTFGYYLNGSLDDIGIWNRALTQCEIQDLYNSQLNSGVGISAGTDQSACEGNDITLNGTGGSNYQWNNSVVDGTPFSPTATQDYIVIGEDGNGCLGTDTVNVEVLLNTTATQTETALDSYTWPVNNQTYNQSGTYTTVIPNQVGCDSTITLNLSMQFTGIGENESIFVAVYPNPTASMLTIEGEIENREYVLVDIQGRVVLNGTFKTNKETIDLKTIARGQYMLRIEGKELKVVKE